MKYNIVFRRVAKHVLRDTQKLPIELYNNYESRMQSHH